MVKTNELFDCKVEYIKPLFDKCEYPWQALDRLSEHIKELMSDAPVGFVEISDGVFVGKGVKIDKGARILPPAIIGEGTEIRQGAFIRGGVITGKNCVIGNSTELKNCILLDNAQVPHYNYVGDSILGNFAHLGAGVICSNLKGDGSNVVVHADSEFETGRRKLGAFVGDRVEVGCSCVLNPGCVLSMGCRAYPLLSLRGSFDKDTLIKGVTISQGQD